MPINESPGTCRVDAFVNIPLKCSSKVQVFTLGLTGLVSLTPLFLDDATKCRPFRGHTVLRFLLTILRACPIWLVAGCEQFIQFHFGSVTLDNWKTEICSPRLHPAAIRRRPMMDSKSLSDCQVIRPNVLFTRYRVTDFWEEALPHQCVPELLYLELLQSYRRRQGVSAQVKSNSAVKLAQKPTPAGIHSESGSMRKEPMHSGKARCGRERRASRFDLINLDYGMSVVAAAPSMRARDYQGKVMSAQQVWRQRSQAVRACGARQRSGLQIEHRKKSDLRARKEEESESPAQQPARPYTPANSVRHVLVKTERINFPGMRAAASSAGVVGETGVTSRVETKIKEATHWVDEHHCADSVLCWSAETRRTSCESEVHVEAGRDGGYRLDWKTQRQVRAA
ncbi:hypothetical protein B0H13DRAFT_1880650 [Mycena leptocephala]|nr:hypothetical protein B0H13DRAFT_1880650 [Mycena leptocephala]